MSYGYNEPWSKRAKIGVWAVVGFCLLLVFGLVSCGAMSHYETGPGETAVHESGGIMFPVDAKIVGCIPPSSNGYEGLGEKYINYPITQRTFEFSADQDADSGPIQVVAPNSIDPKTHQSTGTVTMSVSGVATFTLNSICDILKEFQQDIGQKLNADTDDGWTRLLNTYFKPSMEKALDTATKQFEFNGLYANPDVKEQWENKVGELFAQYLQASAGGPYFCGPDFPGPGATEDQCGDVALLIQSPDISDDLEASIEQQQIATQENLAAKRQKATTLTQAQALAQAVKQCHCTPQEYAALLDAQARAQAVQNGDVTMILPGGTPLAMSPPAAQR